MLNELKGRGLVKCNLLVLQVIVGLGADDHSCNNKLEDIPNSIDISQAMSTQASWCVCDKDIKCKRLSQELLIKNPNLIYSTRVQRSAFGDF